MPGEPIPALPQLGVVGVLAFMALFVAMWVAIGGLLARLGGWSTLASRFSTSERVEGIRKWLVSADLRRPWNPLPVNYSNCLKITVTAQGFRLAPILLFRAFHTPLWVPWQDVASVTEVRMLLLFPGARIAFRDVSPILRVWGSAGRALCDSCPPALLVRT
jgi:hypothetical protein